MLGLRCELADRHVFDHAPTQRADGLLGHGDAPVLSEVVETPRSQDRTLPSATYELRSRRHRSTLPHERFSPLTLTGNPAAFDDLVGGSESGRSLEARCQANGRDGPTILSGWP